MNRKLMLMASGAGLLCAGMVVANDRPEVVRDGAVLGYWQFNDSTFKKDSSVWGNDITADFPSGMSGVAGGTAAFGYDGSGYLNIVGKPKTVSVSIAKAPAFNNTTAPYFTLAMWFKGDKNMVKLPDEYKSIFNYEIVGYKEAHFSCDRVLTPWMGNVDIRWHGMKERGTEKENVKAALGCAN